MPKMTDEDQAIYDSLPDSKAEVVETIDAWLDDQSSSVEPIVQGVLSLMGEKEPDTDDPMEHSNYINKLQTMRTFIPSTGVNLFIRSPEGLVVALSRLAKL